MANKKESELYNHLPIAKVLSRLKAALDHHHSAVLVAPPGAGKTTVVPLALLNERWLSGQRMLLLAPRRLAARAAAHRMAALLDQNVGRIVGYRVRMESRVGPETLIEVVTEGVLTRMLQHDPSLAGVGLVIFDEFHERSLNADLGLAFCRDIQGVLNEDLRLLVMSATLDPRPVADMLDQAPLIRCEGRMFPVETRYVTRPPNQTVEHAVAGVIRQSAAADEGNILVFLPGAPEIRRVALRLKNGHLPGGYIIAPLYGNLPRRLQDEAIAPLKAGRRKIVLATAIAETSLTIQQIRVVVDSGLQRAPRFDPVSGMTRLVTLPVSQASADQRRGRAGRLGPGICYRLWPESTHRSLPLHNRPEILDTDLAGLALELAVWGLDAPDSLYWLDAPPAAAFSLARQLLMELDALDKEGRITSHGRRMADLPLHPRLAHMMLAARKTGTGITAGEIAAILSERDPLHFTGRERDADLRLRLDALRAFRANRPFRHPGCRIDLSAMRQLLKVSAALERQLGTNRKSDGSAEPGRLLAWAYPDRVAQQRPDRPGHFLLTTGRGAFFNSPEPLSANEYLVAAHLDGDRREARIFMAAAIDKECIVDQFPDRIRWQENVSWDANRKAVSAVRRRVLGALTLDTAKLDNPAPEAVLGAMLAGIRNAGIASLPWTRDLRKWQARVMLLRNIDAEGGPWPDTSDAALAETLENWLAHYLSGMKRLSDLGKTDFSNAIRNRLSWQQRQRLEALAPTHIKVPSGSRLPVDYSKPIPVLAVRIQEMFGAIATPAIAKGQLPIMLHLLSPAGRPAQITRDIAGFWHNSYPEIKKELKGRYPKHAWPDDPTRSTPTARAKPRKSN